MNFMDYKFILIPVTFILLRMWTCILGILTEYASVDEKKNSVVLTILLYLGVSHAVFFLFFFFFQGQPTNSMG